MFYSAMQAIMNSSLTRLCRIPVYIVIVSLISACSPLKNLTLTGATMGTTWTVKVIDVASEVEEQELQAGIQSIVDLVNQRMSTYQADSELSRFNREQPGVWFSISQDTWLVIHRGLSVSELTAGSFDMTVGPLVNLWGFGPDPSINRSPSPDDIKQALYRVGYHGVKLSEGEPYQVMKEQDIYLDLSAIAKGYAVDQVANYLADLGVNNYMVEIGGELRLKGYNKRGTGWRIAVESPLVDQRMVQRTLLAGDMAIATSGDYRNYFETGGVRYSHTIDPKSGYPISHNLASVTVVTPKAIVADSLATAFMVMGAESGLALAERENIAVLFIVKGKDGFEEVHSNAFSPFLEE
jgi:thiamine biosynthesis lipoprotein